MQIKHISLNYLSLFKVILTTIYSIYNFIHNICKAIIFEFNTELLMGEENDKNFLFLCIETPNLSVLKAMLRTTGLSVNIKSSFQGNSLLHKAIMEHNLLAEEQREENLRIGEYLLENGCNIDAQNEQGYTPLHVACCCGVPDWIHLLICYGADALITCNRGVLPISALNLIAEPDDEIVSRILYDYTFDGDEKIEVSLSTIVNTLEIEPNQIHSYPNIIRNVAKINYDLGDLKYFYHTIPTMVPRCFELFKNDYGYIMKDIINSTDLLFFCLDFVICRSESEDSELSDSNMNQIFSGNVFEILEIILEDDDLTYDLVQNSTLILPTIHYIVHLFDLLGKNLNQLTKFVCILLSRGLHVTSVDIETVYLRYGYCELFRILLHMDVELLNDSHARSIMLMLYFNVDLTLNDILRDNRCHLYVFLDFSNVIDYFSSREIKEIALNSCNDYLQRAKIRYKIQQMPNVPSLLELSRNQARSFIVKKYQIKNLKQFYRVLNDISIGRVYMKILSYELKLYNY